jgi:hypothetical protein
MGSIHLRFREPRQQTIPFKEGVDWDTGFNRSGEPLLIIRNWPNDLLLRFASDGALAEITRLPGSPSDEYSLHDWLIHAGFQSGVISVRRFVLPEEHVAITDFPLYFQDILRNPMKYTPEERAFAERELARWSAEGLFEFALGEDRDVWINKDGEIVAT